MDENNPANMFKIVVLKQLYQFMYWMYMELKQKIKKDINTNNDIIRIEPVLGKDNQKRWITGFGIEMEDLVEIYPQVDIYR